MILVIDKRDGDVLGSFYSFGEAAKATRVPASTIRSSLRMGTLTEKRFFFRNSEDWKGYEVFKVATHCPVIATKDMGDGKRLVRWFPTNKAMADEIGASANHIGNAIRGVIGLGAGRFATQSARRTGQ